MTKRRVKPEHVRREEIMNAALDVIMKWGYPIPPLHKLQKPSCRPVLLAITLATNKG